LIFCSAKAERQVVALRDHFENHRRVPCPVAALDAAGWRIERGPTGGLTAPRPCPQLARYGLAWIKEGRYWIAYSANDATVIAGVFFETANIPRWI
jgi:hypothetical protein